MLNEFKEFEAYVTNPESSNPRVQPLMLTDHFDEEGKYLIGIEEIMTVIVRGYLLSKGHKIYSKDGQLNEKLIEETQELLHRWTGFSDSKYRTRTKNARLDKWMQENAVEDGWLKKYWMFQFLAFEKKKKSKKTQDEIVKKAEERWEKLEEKWNYSFNSPMDYSAAMITYRNVIANALEKGPLKNRYLVVKKSVEKTDDDKKSKKEAWYKYLTDKSSRHEESYMKIMKIIATYLINKENHPVGQNEIWIKSSDLSRWYALDDAKNGLKSWYPLNVTWNGHPIYTIKRFRAKYTKVIVNQEYLEKYDFRIIDPKDAGKYRETHLVLEDIGHGMKNCWNIK